MAQFEKDLSAFSFYGDKCLVSGKLLVKATVAEYPGDSGISFDEFYTRLEEA
jgi:hypothetical protein